MYYYGIILIYVTLHTISVPMSIRIDKIPNRNSPPTILIRDNRRKGKKIIKKTLCNITHLPPAIIAGIEIAQGRCRLRFIQRPARHTAIPATRPCRRSTRSFRSLGLDRILGRHNTRLHRLACAAVVARVVCPASKLETARLISCDTSASSLGTLLSLGQTKCWTCLTGWSSASRGSKKAWHDVILRGARWCSRCHFQLR